MVDAVGVFAAAGLSFDAGLLLVYVLSLRVK
jgi:hypothetical protein